MVLRPPSFFGKKSGLADKKKRGRALIVTPRIEAFYISGVEIVKKLGAVFLLRTDRGPHSFRLISWVAKLVANTPLDLQKGGWAPIEGLA